MPRFFFHLRDETGFVQDEEGREFASLGEARTHALEGIRSIVSEDAKYGRIDLTGELEVADESGAALLKVGFGEAVEVHQTEQRG